MSPPVDFFAALLDEFDLARAPGFLDPRLERAVHAKYYEPALAGDGLKPVVLKPLRCFRSKVVS